MNGPWIADALVVLLVGLLIFLAWRSIRKQKCAHDCASCHGGCSISKTPSFVEAYRRDHPKTGPDDPKAES